MNSGGSDGHGLKNKIKRASAGIVKVSLLAQLTAAAILAMGLMTSVLVPSATAQQVGSVTGLPLPRYVSLKSDRVNLREGPSKEHRTVWLFQRAGLPVEITAEFDTWRKIRDSEGSEGWVLHSLLSGRRTVIISPWRKGAEQPLYSRASDTADVVANLQTGVISNVRRCDRGWCRIYGSGYDGYMQQKLLWGVYPDEKVE